MEMGPAMRGSSARPTYAPRWPRMEEHPWTTLVCPAPLAEASEPMVVWRVMTAEELEKYECTDNPREWWGNYQGRESPLVSS